MVEIGEMRFCWKSKGADVDGFAICIYGDTFLINNGSYPRIWVTEFHTMSIEGWGFNEEG